MGRVRWFGGRYSMPRWRRARDPRGRALGAAGGCLRCAQEWTPAFAGDADLVRFHCRWSISNGDRRRQAANDSVGGVGFLLEMNAGRRLGQGGGFGLRVPITRSDPQPHLERCRGALHEAHEKHQHRIDPAIERRQGHYSVGCGSCSCHAGHYKPVTSPADLAPMFPPKFSGKSLKSRPKFS